MRLFIIEAALVGVFSGWVEAYAAAYCLFLKAGDFQIALLASIPLLVSSVVQLKAPTLLQKLGSRKKVLRLTIVAHTFLSFAMAFAYLLGAKVGANVLIFGFCLSAVAGQISYPAWMSWVGELVSEKRRGEFFAKRTRANHLALFGSALLGGAFLSFMKTKAGDPALGFCILYIVGGCVRLVCLPLINKITDPPLPILSETNPPNLKDFSKNIFRHNFGWFVVLTGLINLAIFMTHPFLAPYFLEHLKISYFNYGLLFATVVIAKVAFYPLWGDWVDRYSAKKILAVSSLLFAFAPLLLIFSNSLFYLFWVQAYRGLAWSGFEIVSLKFLLDATKPEDRAHFISYHTVYNGILGVLGSMGGGLVVGLSFLHPGYFQAFLLGTFLQLLTTILLVLKIKNPLPS